MHADKPTSAPSNPTALSAEDLAVELRVMAMAHNTTRRYDWAELCELAASLILTLTEDKRRLDAALDRAVQEIELMHESSVYARSGNAKYAESCGKTYASQFAIDAAATPPNKAASGS